MEPALLGMTETESRVGVNRRQIRRNGAVDFGQNPWGPFDPTMTVIAVKSARDGRGILNLIHYGCHGTAAGCNREISRDWPGMMTDRMYSVAETASCFLLNHKMISTFMMEMMTEMIYVHSGAKP